MNDNERFSQKHIILFSFLIGIVFLLLFGFGIITQILTIFLPGEILFIPGMGYLLSAINNFIAFILLIIILKRIDLFNNISWNFKGVKKGLILGVPLIIFTLVQMYLIFDAAPDKSIVISLIPIINAVIYCISIGLWEETLCRGLFLTNMLKKWGNTKKGIIKSIVLSSMIFGILHIISAINGNLISSLIQVAYASIMGILLAVIYIKTKSLWSAIILHIILNFAAYLMPFLVPNSVGMDQGLFIIILILFNLVFLIYSYFIIINIKVEDVQSFLNHKNKSIDDFNSNNFIIKNE
ncbi:CPBP family intramembrane metalloprotease [Methanobrevibacter sp. OttesenSCG-928-K11]|nr:CPBP family intramembrane metalloprotease [Methanobrevibacter sp. OttesenSCG-928-K11]MDL2270837.1 CPBP family intramembrane metalloprotease [Methanobrevibacter sp. OttesenSCG-928-I08]